MERVKVEVRPWHKFSEEREQLVTQNERECQIFYKFDKSLVYSVLAHPKYLLLEDSTRKSEHLLSQHSCFSIVLVYVPGLMRSAVHCIWMHVCLLKWSLRSWLLVYFSTQMWMHLCVASENWLLCILMLQDAEHCTSLYLGAQLSPQNSWIVSLYNRGFDNWTDEAWRNEARELVAQIPVWIQQITS